jgi:hypothetical protein
MITLSELLQDKKFKEYFLDAPRSMPGAGPLPWRVWAQREVDGSWGKKDFPTYVEAFKFLKPKIGQWHNAALASRAVAYGPPVVYAKLRRRGAPVIDEKTGKQKSIKKLWLPKLPTEEVFHDWCPYCRRPTVFGYFARHHSFASHMQNDIMKRERRCSICGAGESFVRHLGALN